MIILLETLGTLVGLVAGLLLALMDVEQTVRKWVI